MVTQAYKKLLQNLRMAGKASSAALSQHNTNVLQLSDAQQ